MSTSTTVDASDLLANAIKYQYNPAAIQQAVLKKLSDSTNGGVNVVDPSNPFVFCLESSVVLTSAAMVMNEANTRKQYPVASQTEEDLYRHMSDMDYVDRFAVPATTRFALLMPKEEVLSKLVLDTETGIKKIIIPRNTFFTVADTIFSLQYPIEIRQLQHGGLQVIYDASIVSPLQTLTSNIIDFEIRSNSAGEWIYFEFDVQQFNIISQTSTINLSVDFNASIAINDQFYYARVYAQNNTGNWIELYTTHTDQIYDITKPTAVLKVANNVLNVSIPQIYISNGILSAGVRIDVYETKGVLNLILSDYPITAFSATWKAYDPSEQNIFTAPLKTFKTIVPYSDKAVIGGRNALTFSELRERVIQNSVGAQKLPITNVQIESSLANLGYDVVKNVDNITNRIFLATNKLPSPTDPNLITGADASIETLSLSTKAAVLNTGVIDNDSSITITPKTIYKILNGIVNMVSNEELAYLMGLAADKRAIAVNAGNYLYTPFHYVLDNSGIEFDCRPYYLDNPQIETKSFVEENDTTLLQVNTGTYGITKTDVGYEIRIVTNSGDSYKNLPDNQVFVQLAFVPEGEKDLAYLNGLLVGKNADGERIYKFDIRTNLNINKNDYLQLANFYLYTIEQRLTGVGLLTDFDIIYSTTYPMGGQWKSSNVDTILGRFILPMPVVGITHEKLRVNFGYALNTLWSRARSIISSVPNKTWEVNVPRIYTEDVYERDTNGSFININGNGDVVYNILHAKGDPVLDINGAPTYLHMVGDVVLDTNGNPVPSDTRGMIHQIDIMLIEGVYWFATDNTTVSYRNNLTNAVVDKLMNDFSSISEELLEQTKIYYYPKTTLGNINVIIGNDVIQSIDANQSFNVVLYVNPTTYADEALKQQLSKTTVQTISNSLNNTIVSIDEITTNLRSSYGNDVISVQVTGLGGNANLQTFTIIDDTARCSIKKRLTALADNNLIVEEDINITFVVHS